MKGSPVHLICALGDPTLPTVWSGVPYRIFLDLKRLGRLGETHFIRLGTFWQALDRCGRLVLREQDRAVNTSTVMNVARMWATRRWSARLANTGPILHFGTREFPCSSRGRLKQQYVFVDATFGSWMKERLRPLVSASMLQALEDRERRCFEQAEHVFCAGQYVKNLLELDYGIAPERVTAVGTGLGGIQPYAGPKRYARGNILFVSKSNFEKKGGRLTVAGVRLLREQGIDVQLTLVGSAQYPDEYQGIPWLRLLGRLPPGGTELQGLFEEHTLFAMPSVYDAWGMAWLEALACRMPVVGLNRNAFPEICGNGRYGFILSNETPEEFARVVKEALANPERLEKMGGEGQAHVLRQYSWENTCARMLEIMDRNQPHEK